MYYYKDCFRRLLKSIENISTSMFSTNEKNVLPYYQINYDL